ncbi:MAG: hypothetical protein IPM31_16690 [Anaerolineae bacterium]|nr:hypothetical protein [Anaerolineae bacterium]
MKIKIFTSILATLFLVINSSCSAVYPTTTITKTSTSPDSIRDSYNDAREKWNTGGVVNYNITVDVFSSILPPPCQMIATLVVMDNKLFSIQELVTPVTIELPENQSIQNPECSDYERYTISNQFEFVEDILENSLSYEISSIEFDSDYGYISHLVITTKGEAYKEVLFTDFNIR